jgi:hypothetical protein
MQTFKTVYQPVEGKDFQLGDLYLKDGAVYRVDQATVDMLTAIPEMKESMQKVVRKAEGEGLLWDMSPYYRFLPAPGEEITGRKDIFYNTVRVLCPHCGNTN